MVHQDNNYTPNIVWKILRKHLPYNRNTKRCSLRLNKKLEILEMARCEGHNLLNKRSKMINKCRHQNKFALALYDSQDWTKFSVSTFEKPYVRSHSFQKCDCFMGWWSQPGYGNQCFRVLVGLLSSHAYEIIVSPSFVGSQLTWN